MTAAEAAREIENALLNMERGVSTLRRQLRSSEEIMRTTRRQLAPAVHRCRSMPPGAEAPEDVAALAASLAGSIAVLEEAVRSATESPTGTRNFN